MKAAFLLSGGMLAWFIHEPVAWAAITLCLAVPLGVVIALLGGR